MHLVTVSNQIGYLIDTCDSLYIDPITFTVSPTTFLSSLYIPSYFKLCWHILESSIIVLVSLKKKKKICKATRDTSFAPSEDSWYILQIFVSDLTMNIHALCIYVSYTRVDVLL